MKTFRFTIIIFIFAVIFSLPIFTQDCEDELKTSVDELKQFHTTIYELWHNAWPNNDIERLKTLLPEIEDGYSSLRKAKLPGILRDKTEAWDNNLDIFEDIIKEYQDAVEKNDTSAILDAAEKVHTQFETLVRVIRPVLKEVDDFHKTLYMLYHYYVPNYDYDKIKKSVDELIKKMKAINTAELPKRLKERQKEFNKARKELTSSLNELKTQLKNKKNNQFSNFIKYFLSAILFAISLLIKPTTIFFIFIAYKLRIFTNCTNISTN